MRTPPRRVKQAETPGKQQTRERTGRDEQAPSTPTTPRRRGRQAAAGEQSPGKADTQTQSRTKKQRAERTSKQEIE